MTTMGPQDPDPTPPFTEFDPPQASHAVETPVFDGATFQGFPAPRREGLFVGDERWHQLAKAYRAVQLITTGLWIVAIAIIAIVVNVLSGADWVWIPAGVLLVILVIVFIITPRQVRSIGFRLRENDLVLRRGILFQRVVAVPYGRMQLVDITHGPLDRAFGIAQLKLVTAAAATAVVLPGLTQAAAEELRDVLIEVAESRRTGL